VAVTGSRALDSGSCRPHDFESRRSRVDHDCLVALARDDYIVTGDKDLF
jgi:hypothetical protein